MGFIDKVKATVKTGAEQAAAKAQEEYEKMQRRHLYRFIDALAKHRHFDREGDPPLV